MTWTDSELQELDAIRYRRATVRALRGIAAGLGIVVALRSSIPAGAGAWLIMLAIAQCWEPTIPDHLEKRARELDRAQGGGR